MRAWDNMEATTIAIPNHFSFKDHNIFSCEQALNIFDWSLNNQKVLIDFSGCNSANYQTLSLVALYVWHLKCHGCHVEFNYSHNDEGASKMWVLMGARGWHHILVNENQQFNGNEFKPLIALRKQSDFSLALSKAEAYTKNFDVEYEKTLRYVISELLYNTLEHGKSYCMLQSRQLRVPSIIQFTWYKRRNELQFIIADIGIGIKKHLEQTYEPFVDDESAIKKAIRPQVSGTFGISDPYKSKDNAGVGLYISSNIVRRLNAEMHIISGNGLVHISPRDITSSTINSYWPGTFVVVSVSLSGHARINLHKMMAEFREAAANELSGAEQVENENRHYLSINNYFGPFAEDKASAVKYRNNYLMPVVERGENIVIDFSDVSSAPHSFLSALLATVIKRMGMSAYKKIKIMNADPEIRETIDYILDENT